MKKYLSFLFTVMLCMTLVLGACTNTGGGDNGDKITYTKYANSTIDADDFSLVNQKKSDDNFDHNIYYRNDLKLDMGDPMVVYDDESKLFYAYGTRGGYSSMDYYTSDNLTDWTYGGVAFQAPQGSWAYRTDNIWAPDVQKIGNKYYMYFTFPGNAANGNHCQIGVAVGDSLTKFELYTGVNANGQNITLADNTFSGMENATILDPTVFEDDDGKIYMYFSYDTTKAQTAEQEGKYAEIWGVRLLDPVTWDLSTLTRLTVPGYKNLNDTGNNGKGSVEWEYWSASFTGEFRCSEGPYMIKKNGKYILTHVSNSFVDNQYNVGYAVSDSPLGEYDKPWSEEDPLANMLLGVPGNVGSANDARYKGMQTGTGHASIVDVNGEYMFAYHAHVNRDSWGVETEYSQYTDRRAGAFDYLYFTQDGTPYTNGPTWSLQRLPEAISGYKNLATGSGVTVRAETIDKAQVKYLTDNRTSRVFDSASDARFAAGTRSIEIKFDKAVSVKAVNIYNAADFNLFVSYIDQIDFGNNKGVANIYFNPAYIGSREVTSGTQQYIYPHTAFTVCLTQPVTTDRIVITISSDKDFALGEIEILGGTL